VGGKLLKIELNLLKMEFNPAPRKSAQNELKLLTAVRATALQYCSALRCIVHCAAHCSALRCTAAQCVAGRLGPPGPLCWRPSSAEGQRSAGGCKDSRAQSSFFPFVFLHFSTPFFHLIFLFCTRVAARWRHRQHQRQGGGTALTSTRVAAWSTFPCCVPIRPPVQSRTYRKTQIYTGERPALSHGRPGFGSSVPRIPRPTFTSNPVPHDSTSLNSTAR
jgi:hypothetical protein